jgi:hypothetical protein
MLTSLHYDAQVVCLQEVTPRMFQQDLAPLLAGGGGFAGGGGYLGVHSAMEGSDCRSARYFFSFFPPFGRGRDEADTYVRVSVCVRNVPHTDVSVSACSARSLLDAAADKGMALDDLGAHVCVGIRLHTSAYADVCHTAARMPYCSIRQPIRAWRSMTWVRTYVSAYVCIRQRMLMHAILQHTSADKGMALDDLGAHVCVGIRRHTSAYADVCRRMLCKHMCPHAGICVSAY